MDPPFNLSRIQPAFLAEMAGQSKRKADGHACVQPPSSHIGMAITVWYIEGEDDVEEVEYKVWIVDFLRHQSQIAVEDDDRWALGGRGPLL